MADCIVVDLTQAKTDERKHLIESVAVPDVFVDRIGGIDRIGNNYRLLLCVPYVAWDRSRKETETHVVCKVIVPREALTQFVVAISSALANAPDQTKLELLTFEPGAAAN
jgi:hypothetical protein